MIKVDAQRFLDEEIISSTEVVRILQNNGFIIKPLIRIQATLESDSLIVRIVKSRDRQRKDIGLMTITVEPKKRSKYYGCKKKK